MMRRACVLLFASVALLTGCGVAPDLQNLPAVPRVTTSVTPSPTGIPLSVVTFGDFEFVSVQQSGQIFTYNIATGTQVLAVAPYATPCKDPSGMVIAGFGGGGVGGAASPLNVMAVVCYDTGSLLTLSVHADGSLTALGSVSGLAAPYPGIALDGTDVYVPLFGIPLQTNGGVAKVSIASPATPSITAVTPLASPFPGATANPGKLTLAGGYIYVSAGSETSPQSLSSTIQVMRESTMALVGAPFVVAHSPQQIAVKGSVAYVALFDAMQLQSVDASDPTLLKPLQTLSLAAGKGCSALPVEIRDNTAYVGCYQEGTVQRVDISDPAHMQPGPVSLPVDHPQHLQISGQSLFVTSSVTGGSVSSIPVGPSN